MVDVSDNRSLFSFGGVQFQRWPWSLERHDDLDHPSVTAGNRVYSVSTQHGEFPEIGWRQPSEMSGVWDPPIKLLDGFWLGLTPGPAQLARPAGKIHWLTQASRWRLLPGQVEITYQWSELEIVRREYGVDDYEGLLVRLEIHNRGPRAISFTLHFLAETDLRLAWLAKDRLLWRDGRDEAAYLDELGCVAAYNTINPAYVLFGARRRPSSVALGNERRADWRAEGQGIAARLSYALHLSAGEHDELTFTIAGSTSSSEAALATFRQMQTETEVICERQSVTYQDLFARCALYSSDELMETAFGWAKATLRMLERHVPGVGRGIAAGLPDHPWWLGNDTTYAILPLVASGQFELALNSLRNLIHYSELVNGDGAVVHEILTQGHVHDNGLLVEIPLFVRACYHTFRWTGDRVFLQEIYGFCQRGLLDVVLGKHDLEGTLCASGRGLVETRELQRTGGMKTLDIAAYTYEALLLLAELAEEVNDDDNAALLREKARRLAALVNANWWIEEEGLYGDIFISAEALSASHQSMRSEKIFWPGDIDELEHSDTLLKQFTQQYATNETELRRERPWLLKHMIAATPVEAKLVPPERASRVLSRLESDEFNGPWGIYLNPVTQRVTMTLPNALMASAEAQYGRMDQALAYCHKIAGAIAHQMPGAYSEILPDGGCFIQAWSSYGIIWPVVHFFLGFRPDAGNRRVHFVPHLPAAWQRARLQEVRVGSATFTLQVTHTEKKFQATLETTDPAYEITLGGIFATHEDSEPQSVTLNGAAVLFTLERRVEASAGPQETGTYLVQLPARKGLQRYEFIVTWECP